MSLTHEQWSQVERLFGEAYEQAQPLRWLQHYQQRGNADPEVLAEVTALLEAGLRGGPAPSVNLIARDADEVLPAFGELLAPWRLIGLLGRGGMGEVYLAERADGAYEQQVALKLLKRGVDTNAVLRRFLRERRILGRLSHPNIARLLDAGSAPDGRPFLVMERVSGQPITDWCRNRTPDVRQILELMVGVCEAVHAAHRQQVVHRDLKPSNVLVSSDGAVKLLDFGIAKLLGEDEQEQTQTAIGTALATPQYAAPEQLLGREVTPACDVFSLGMLLYELLTASLPPWRQSPLMALAGAQDQRALTRPSQALLRGDSPRWDAAARRERSRQLEGELDLIVLKAAEHDPQRRYATAAELADDLRRHLDGRPVLAQPESLVYSVRKFVARHRVIAAATVAVIVALSTGLGLALWQGYLARQRADELRTVVDFQSAMLRRVDVHRLGSAWLERIRSNVAARLREQPAAQPAVPLDAFERLLDLSQPSEVARETLGSYLLDPERAEIERSFAANPATAARLHQSLGQAYTDLGLYSGAIEEFQSAASADAAAFGAKAPETLESRRALAVAQENQGELDKAQETIQGVIGDSGMALGEAAAGTLLAKAALASILTKRGDYAAARKLQDAVLPQISRAFGADGAETLQAESDLALTMSEQAQYAQAQALDEHILEIRRRRLGPEHPDTLATLLELARELRLQDQFALSRDRSLEYLDIAARIQGQDDPRTLRAEKLLANSLAGLGDYTGASKIEERVLAVQSRELGEDNLQTVSTMHNHAITLATLGDLGEALELEQKVVEARRRSLGNDSAKTLAAVFTTAEILQLQGQYEAALRAVNSAYEGQLKLLGAEHPATLASEARLASVLCDLNRSQQALPLAAEALQLSARLFGSDDETTNLARTTLAKIRAHQGDYLESIDLARAALESEQRTLRADDPVIKETQAQLKNYLQHRH